MTDLTPQPDVKSGLEYWKAIPASLDGVLGGFGNGPLPRVDALSSPLKKLNAKPLKRRVRAVDVGAGIGRVTSTVLLPLVSDVVLVEPVETFIQQAIKLSPEWRGISDQSKSVTFIQDTLQSFDPSKPLLPTSPKTLARVGFPGEPSSPNITEHTDPDQGFDVIWCQWCLGHLSDADLIPFFRSCRKALRDTLIDDGDGKPYTAPGYIIVKENTCFDEEGGKPASVYDEQDSSVTRSNAAWHAIFKEAGLEIVKQQTQLGFPPGLYTVISYALR